MGDFIIHFLLCNVLISGIICILLIAKRIFKNILSGRMQYNLWIIFLGLSVIPFLPFRLAGFSRLSLWVKHFQNPFASGAGSVANGIYPARLAENPNWMNDFALSVNREVPESVWLFLWGIWITGILIMALLMVKTLLRLHALHKSALPVQDAKLKGLYDNCLQESGIRKDIPLYGTAFLKSPVTAGLLKPRIYLPLPVISQFGQFQNSFSQNDIRYMLLHELQHYKYKDSFINVLMNLTAVFYWFNPFVWYALKEMKDYQEIACDASVLNILGKDLRTDYGNTLINFAERMSFGPFFFTSSLTGNRKQIKQRIIHIAAYEKPAPGKKLRSAAVFLLAVFLLLNSVPFLSAQAKSTDYFQWDFEPERVSYLDLSSYFGEYEGSFVFYDSKHDTWRIHDMEHALCRIAPNSTYKIYDALFALKEGIITPDDSFMSWDGKAYPFNAWNADQTLQSAMASSVNWYFQSLDRQIGKPSLQGYFHEIGYGNEDLSGGLSSYWQESSLKISPIEQVLLLTKLHQGELSFSPENVKAVTDSLYLFSSETGNFYGKTGTGQVNGMDISGWFVGYMETNDNTYFFATNISAGQSASGSVAVRITMSVLNTFHFLTYG